MQDKEREFVCITGSTGFVGRHIAHELCSRGLKVRCMVRASSDLAPLSGLPVEICRGNVTDEASLQSALQGVVSVVHLVAIIRGVSGLSLCLVAQLHATLQGNFRKNLPTGLLKQSHFGDDNEARHSAKSF